MVRTSVFFSLLIIKDRYTILRYLPKIFISKVQENIIYQIHLFCIYENINKFYDKYINILIFILF